MIHLDIMNVDTGHTTLTFDPKNAEQLMQAEKQINDMIQQGYAVFVETDGKTERIDKFDPKNTTYLLGDKETKVTPVAPPSGGCVCK